MNARRFFLDPSAGETRGVVTLDDQPERFIVRRHDEDAALSLGAQFVARVASIEPALATAFLDLGEGREAILPFKPDTKPVRGAALTVEIRAEPRSGKLAIARATGEGHGAPRLLTPAGTISIGGVQACVQCLAAPSGWHLLGRTPVRTYHPHRDPMFLMEPGDAVTFYPLPASEFDELDRAAGRGEIVAELVPS